MNNGNRVGSRNGGFHSYRRFSQPTPAHSHSPATKMSMELPDHLNQAIAANVEDSQSTIQEQDRFMPITNLIRIMCRILPPHAKILNDSKLTIQECVSEFISFVTGEANKHCQHDQCKIITAEDLLWAMNNFGFDDYIEPLTLYLHRYHENNGGEHGSPRGEPLLLRHSMVNLTSGCITPYHFVYPPPMGNGYMQGDVSNESTSQCAVTAVDSEVDSPAKEGME